MLDENGYKEDLQGFGSCLIGRMVMNKPAYIKAMKSILNGFGSFQEIWKFKRWQTTPRSFNLVL